MAHHVLHVAREDRLAGAGRPGPAPGRTVVFTRTKHGAKTLTRQLNAPRRARRRAARQPGPERPHPQPGRVPRRQGAPRWSPPTSRPAASTSTTSALVIHADPPVEHKAYLHRSGRTARAGDAGTVVTLMTDEQVRDVRDLTRAAGIKPTTTRVDTPATRCCAAGPRRAPHRPRWAR